MSCHWHMQVTSKWNTIYIDSSSSANAIVLQRPLSLPAALYCPMSQPPAKSAITPETSLQTQCHLLGVPRKLTLMSAGKLIPPALCDTEEFKKNRDLASRHSSRTHSKNPSVCSCSLHPAGPPTEGMKTGHRSQQCVHCTPMVAVCTLHSSGQGPACTKLQPSIAQTTPGLH